MTNATTAPHPDIGLLLVHGIGEQRPGATARGFVQSLRRAVPRATVDEEDGRTTVEVDGRTIRLYEVYWADLLNGEIARNTFDFDTALALPWFPGLNRRNGLHGARDYPRWLTGLRTVELLVLSTAAVFTYWAVGFITLGVKFLAGVWGLLRGRRPESGSFEREQKEFLRRVLETLRGRGIRRDRASWGAADFLVDNFGGDVLTYVGSCLDALPEESPVRGKAAEIIGRFGAALRAASDDGCAEIQVLAHSLGTVIAYHGLTEFRPRGGETPAGADGLTEDALSRVTRLYTIGSPLEKIRFLWPQLIPAQEAAPGPGAGEAAPGGADLHAVRQRRRPQRRQRFRWDNFRGRYDVVSGKLAHFNHWGTVRNHRVRRGGFLRSHGIYQRSPEFLEILLPGLVGRPVRLGHPVRRLLRRVLGPIASFFENWWLTVTGVAMILIYGIFACGFVAILAVQVLTLPLTLTGHERIADLIGYATFAVTGVVVLVGVAWRGRSLSPGVHARYAGTADISVVTSPARGAGELQVGAAGDARPAVDPDALAPDAHARGVRR